VQAVYLPSFLRPFSLIISCCFFLPWPEQTSKNSPPFSLDCAELPFLPPSPISSKTDTHKKADLPPPLFFAIDGQLFFLTQRRRPSPPPSPLPFRYPPTFLPQAKILLRSSPCRPEPPPSLPDNVKYNLFFSPPSPIFFSGEYNGETSSSHDAGNFFLFFVSSLPRAPSPPSCARPPTDQAFSTFFLYAPFRAGRQDWNQFFPPIKGYQPPFFFSR